MLHENIVYLLMSTMGKMRINSFPDEVQEHVSGRHSSFLWVHFFVTLLYLTTSSDLSSLRNSTIFPWGFLQEKQISFTLCKLEETVPDNIRSVSAIIPVQIQKTNQNLWSTWICLDHTKKHVPSTFVIFFYLLIIVK